MNEITAQHAPARPAGHTVDHVVPVSFGFNHSVPAELIGSRENLRAVPFQANLAKGAMITDDAARLLHRWGYGHVALLYAARRVA